MENGIRAGIFVCRNNTCMFTAMSVNDMLKWIELASRRCHFKNKQNYAEDTRFDDVLVMLLLHINSGGTF